MTQSLAMAIEQENQTKVRDKEIANWVLQKLGCRAYAVRKSFADHKYLPVALGEMANAVIAEQYSRVFSYDTVLGDIVPVVTDRNKSTDELSASKRLEWLVQLAVEVGWNDETKDDFVYDDDALADPEFKSKFNFASAARDYQKLASLRVRAEVFTNTDIAAKLYNQSISGVYLEAQLLNRRTVDLCPASFFVKNASGYFTVSLTWVNRVTVETPAQRIYAHTGELILTGYAPKHNSESDVGVLGGIPLRAAFSRQPASQNC